MFFAGDKSSWDYDAQLLDAPDGQLSSSQIDKAPKELDWDSDDTLPMEGWDRYDIMVDAMAADITENAPGPSNARPMVLADPNAPGPSNARPVPAPADMVVDQHAVVNVVDEDSSSEDSSSSEYSSSSEDDANSSEHDFHFQLLADPVVVDILQASFAIHYVTGISLT